MTASDKPRPWPKIDADNGEYRFVKELTAKCMRVLMSAVEVVGVGGRIRNNQLPMCNVDGERSGEPKIDPNDTIVD